MRATILTSGLLGIVVILLFLPAVDRPAPAPAPRPAEPDAPSRLRPTLPGQTPAVLAAAASAVAAGRWEEAFAEARAARLHGPRDAFRGHLLAGVAAMRCGRADEARGSLEAALAAEPAHPLAAWASWQLAEACRVLGDPHAAEAALARALGGASPAWESAARLAHARLLAELGRARDARTVVEPLTDPAAEPEVRAEALALLGAWAEAEGDEGAAARWWHELAIWHPASAAARRIADRPEWKDAARRALRAGRADEALVRVDRLVETGLALAGKRDAERVLDAKPPRDVADQAHLQLGRALRRLGRPADAVAELGRVSASDPERHARARYGAALAAARLKRQHAQRQFLAEAAAAPPCEWRDRAAVALAGILSERGEQERARALWDLLAREAADPAQRHDAAWSLAWSLQVAGDGEAALAAHELVLGQPRGRRTGASLYWSARLLERAGRADLAGARLEELAESCPNDYHALLAAERQRRVLGLPRPVGAGEAAGLASQRLEALAAADGDAAARVAELLALGFQDEALAELSALDPSALPASAREAAWQLRVLTLGRQGRHLDALRALRASAPDWRCRTDIASDVWRAAYPLGEVPAVIANGEREDVDVALVFGLIHQESVFDPWARSSAGARGLMQIMPGTGQTIARWKGERIRTEDLTDPARNVSYGTTYLRRLLDQFDAAELALAGYNAGGGRVRKWLAATGADDVPLFVESIPFDETREYVKAVTWNRALYRSLWLSGAPAAAEWTSEAVGERAGEPAREPSNAAGAPRPEGAWTR